MTVAPPTGWKQHFGADVMLFEAPGGVGRIRVHMRAPLEPLSAVIARVVAGEVDRWIVDETSAVVTSEGEYGAFSRVSTRANSVGSVRFVGTIFADDTCVTLEGRATRASAESMIESVTRELLLRFTLALGVRRRRFVYAPPAGWDAVPHGLVTSWYPAGFPDDRAQLVVYPAEPTYSDGRLELEQLLTSERDRGAEVQGEICADVIEAAGWSVSRGRSCCGAPSPVFSYGGSS